MGHNKPLSLRSDIVSGRAKTGCRGMKYENATLGAILGWDTYYIPTPWVTIPTISSSVNWRVEYDTTLRQLSLKLDTSSNIGATRTCFARLQ